MASVGLATRLAARDMGGNAVFGDLKPGDQFYFPGSLHPLWYTKLRGGWYTSTLDRKARYRTGSGTAVVKLGGS